MKFRVQYHLLFGSDVDAYIDWFNAVSPGLGVIFAKAVDQAVDEIERRPNSFPVLQDEYRRLLIQRFRIIIPFTVDGSDVYVAGVVHASRDLHAWFRRRFATDDE